jgi:hypothetical protein
MSLVRSRVAQRYRRLEAAAGSYSRGGGLVAGALLVLLASAFLVLPAQSADEEDTASVYLVFDAETGEFVTMDDPSQKLPADTGVQDSTTGQGQPADAHGDPGGHAGGDLAAVDGGSQGLMAVLAAGLIVAAALVFYLRRRKSGSHGEV